MTRKKTRNAFLAWGRRDRQALAVVTALAAFLIVWPAWSGFGPSGPHPVVDSIWLNSPEPPRYAAQAEDETTERHFPVYPRSARRPEEGNTVLTPFPFDPNSLDESGWKRLGLREKTIQTLMNYRSKGGRFRQPEDLARIYGLRSGEYEQLAPYIRITTGDPGQQARGSYTPVADKFSPDKKLQPIDLNTADTTALIALPGIGPKLAARILQFREKLGGFYSTDQVAETWGLPDSTFQKIKPLLKAGSGPYRKIRINTATLEELRTHPYIRWELARPLLAYRNQHGPFLRLEDIRQVQAITEEQFRKLAPYLVLE